MEYANNQLKVIAEEPNLQRQDERSSRAEVVRQLQEVPELSTRDRVRLMWKIMRNIDDMKAFLEVPNKLKLDYCMGILKDNA
ncbi:retrotransposon protein [Cucumis melo var. makuwa]|uniref:Retrotransposon protein n=1 Tax=Cucumis melo var. makuwa TaxID=1194695 RepID=A0A5D3BQR5_CUCMM|nr:retrotransposon protein [Cucumis melo var. makuwa]TYK00449.1 retrotransposon protein [Cucumis melo var. makuwa]